MEISPYFDVVLSLLLCVWQLASAFCLGNKLFFRLLNERLQVDHISSICLCLLLGNATLAILLQWLALGGIFYPVLNAALLALIMLLFGKKAIPVIRLFFEKLMAGAKSFWADNRFGFLLLVMLAVLLFLNLLAALKPLQIDALAYYLSQAKLIALSHRFGLGNGFLSLLHMGFLLDMVSALFFSLGGNLAGCYAAQIQPFF